MILDVLHAATVVLWHWPHFLEPVSQLWWPESGRLYAFGSSWGGDTAIIVGFFMAIRHLNCHVHGCWRHGRYAFQDMETRETYRLCGPHHPSGVTPPKHWWSTRHIKTLEDLHERINGKKKE